MVNLLPETDRGHLASAVINIYNYSCELNRPSTIYKPRLFLEGNEWCALYGDNLQDGVAGFGNSPAEAFTSFDKEWVRRIKKPPIPWKRVISEDPLHESSAPAPPLPPDKIVVGKVMDMLCKNCGFRDGPVCYNCEGDNFGHVTEATPEGTCKNWKSICPCPALPEEMVVVEREMLKRVYNELNTIRARDGAPYTYYFASIVAEVRNILKGK